ncbi:MAG: hypothetical protein JRI25_16485 [Deltaproteobacteria bacterium]|nr:hypothetical protein [Deltaproteobacteria bacterium]
MELQFSAPSFCFPDDIAKVPTIRLAQLAASGQSRFGAESAEEALRGADYRWEYYRVTQANDESDGFNVWVLDVDTAYVFFANTEQQAGIKMIQNDFDPIDEEDEDDPALVDLAAAMQRAFYQRPGM